MPVPDGLYDLLLTEGLARSLAALEPGSAALQPLQGAGEKLGRTRRVGDLLHRLIAVAQAGHGERLVLIGADGRLKDAGRPCVKAFPVRL